MRVEQGHSGNSLRHSASFLSARIQLISVVTEASQSGAENRRVTQRVDRLGARRYRESVPDQLLPLLKRKSFCHLRPVSETLEKLRHAWKHLNSAKDAATQARTYRTDPSLVYGCAGFALEHLEKARKLIEEVGKELGRRKQN